MTKRLIVDPPSGWLYGFPKEMPENKDMTQSEENQWFLDNGYPQKLIDDGMLKYVRFWYSEDER